MKLVKIIAVTAIATALTVQTEATHALWNCFSKSGFFSNPLSKEKNYEYSNKIEAYT